LECVWEGTVTITLQNSYLQERHTYGMVAPKEDRARHELHTHLSRMGVEGTIIEPGALDFDYDYPYLDLDMPASGATSLGSIRLHGYAVDIVNIVREKYYEVGHLGFGGDYGPQEYVGSGWYLRFFVTHYDEWETQPTPELTEFHLIAKPKVEKGFMSTKVVNYAWESANNAHRTRIEEAVLDQLNSDRNLRPVLLRELSGEGSITLRAYRPKKTPKQTGAEPSYAVMLLHGGLRKKKNIFISRNCLDMYNALAEQILHAKAAL
jgi:hypothetical protein